MTVIRVTMAALWVILSVCIALNYALSCSSNYDCELLGKCVNGVCHCNDGWKGDSCGTLDLGTVHTFLH